MTPLFGKGPLGGRNTPGSGRERYEKQPQGRGSDSYESLNNEWHQLLRERQFNDAHQNDPVEYAYYLAHNITPRGYRPGDNSTFDHLKRYWDKGEGRSINDIRTLGMRYAAIQKSGKVRSESRQQIQREAERTYEYAQVRYTNDPEILRTLSDLEANDKNLKYANDLIENRLNMDRNLYKFVDTPQLLSTISEMYYSNITDYHLQLLQRLGIDTSGLSSKNTRWEVIQKVRPQIPRDQVDDFWVSMCQVNGYTLGRFAKKHGSFFERLGHGISEIFGNPEKNGLVAVCEAAYLNRSGRDDEIANAAVLGEAARLGLKPQDVEQASILTTRLLSSKNVGLVLSDFIGNMDGISGNFDQAAFGEGQFRNIIPVWQDQNRICNAVCDWIENGGYQTHRTLNKGEIARLRKGGYAQLVEEFQRNPMLGLYLRQGVQEDPKLESLSMKTVNSPRNTIVEVSDKEIMGDKEGYEVFVKNLERKFSEEYKGKLEASYSAALAQYPGKKAELDTAYQMALKQDPEKLFKAFYLRSAGLLIDLYNEGFGAGVSFGVESSNAFIQKLHFDFGFYANEGGAMFGFNVGYADSIEVGDNGSIHYDAGVTNFVVPYFVIGYTHTFKNKDTLHHFSQGVGGRPMIDISGGISTVGSFVALSVGKDKLAELEGGRKYYQRGLRDALQGIRYSSDVTEERIYNALRGQGQEVDFSTADRIATSLRNTLENNNFDYIANAGYRNELVASSIDAITQNLYAAAAQNSEGWHFSGLSIGLLNFSIPFVGFRFTNLETKWSIDPATVRRAKFERGVLAGATDIATLPETLGSTTKERVENYFRDAWTGRMSPINYNESNGWVTISSTRGIQTNGAERAYGDVTYSGNSIRFPAGKYDVHLSRMLHPKGEEAPHVILVPTQSSMAMEVRGQALDVKRENWESVGRFIDANYDNDALLASVFKKIEALEKTPFNRPAEMYLRILGLDAKEPGLTNSAHRKVLARLRAMLGDGLVDFVKKNPQDGQIFFKTVMQRGAVDGKDPGELTNQEAMTLLKWLQDMPDESYVADLWDNPRAEVENFAGMDDLCRDGTIGDFGAFDESMKGEKYERIELTHSNILTMYQDAADVKGINKGAKETRAKYSQDLWKTGLTGDVDTFILCGHSFDVQNYLNGLLATIDQLKKDGQYDAIRNKEITFFIRGCSAASAIPDILKYFPKARFIASSADGNTQVNRKIHENILSGRQAYEGVDHPDYIFPSNLSEYVFGEYADKASPEGPIKIHGGKKKKHRPVLTSRVTVGTYDTANYPWVKRTDFGIAVTLPKTESPSTPETHEEPGKPDKDEDEPEGPEEPGGPNGPEEPEKPTGEVKPGSRPTDGNVEGAGNDQGIGGSGLGTNSTDAMDPNQNSHQTQTGSSNYPSGGPTVINNDPDPFNP